MKKMKGECNCGCKMWLMKLSLVSGVFFVLNIWPGAMNWVATMHGGWFLGAAILFCLLAMKHMWMHGMKKKRRR
ncbi:MAG: hypothetical protein Q7S06_02685 [Nanoarchaeota archaeon]|nr:hypothetical protein [Nanoarchaeota archaeon]